MRKKKKTVWLDLTHKRRERKGKERKGPRGAFLHPAITPRKTASSSLESHMSVPNEYKYDG